SVGVPITMAACWFVSNSVEAALGAYLLRREGPVRLESSRNVWRFVLYAGLLAPGLSSFLDAGLVMLNDWGGGTYWRVWEIRFRSNVLAMLTVAPVVITWGTTGLKALREATPRRITEAVVLVLCLLGVSYAAFSTAGGGMTRAPALLYAPLPFLLW